MKLITEFKFNTSISWAAFCDAPIYCKNGHIYYPYGTSSVLSCMTISLDGTAEESHFTVPTNKTACLPSRWHIFEYDGHVILSCGNPKPPTDYFPNRVVCSIFVALDDGMKEITLPPEIAAAHLCPPPIDETAEIRLSDCVMKYKNSRSYQCFDPSGNLLWTEKHKGYRYTPFEERNGCIIFGSAGHGGGLYCYRKQTGECLCAVDTKGTPRYIWCRDMIVSRGRNGELLLIEPFKGEIKDSIRLEGLMSDCSSYFTNGRYLCAVGFEKKTNSPRVYLFDTQAD